MTDATETSPRGSVRRTALLVIVGVIGGFLSGAFGVGGGFIMVPLLTGLVGLDQRRAAATSLLAIIPTSIAGAITYAVQGEVHVLASAILAAGGIVGSLIGTRLLRELPLGWLRWMFFGLLLIIAVRSVIEIPVRDAELDLQVGTILGLVALGLVMGIASGLFGLGGGVIMVPVLVGIFGMGDLLAKGTSLLAIIPTSITGTVQNLRNKLVHWQDGAIAGIAATAASFLGVWMAFWIEPFWSAILFALLVVFVAAQMIVRDLRARRRKPAGN